MGESARLCHERTRSSLHWNCSDSALGSGNVFRATTMTTEQAEGLLWSVAQLLQHLRLSPSVWSKTKGAGVHGMEECACVRVSLCARLPLSCLPLPSFLPTRLPPQRLNHLFSLVPCLSPYNFDPSPLALTLPHLQALFKDLGTITGTINSVSYRFPPALSLFLAASGPAISAPGYVTVPTCALAPSPPHSPSPSLLSACSLPWVDRCQPPSPSVIGVR